MKNFAAGVRGYLFQRRFNSCVLDESHLLAAARYVEQNPVRAGMTKVPWDYPRSSARFHMGITEHDPLVTDRTLVGLVEDWERLLVSSDDSPLNTLRKLTRTGRPAGDAAFVSRIEKITGRDLSKGKPGRPRKRTALGNQVYVPRYRRFPRCVTRCGAPGATTRANLAMG